MKNKILYFPRVFLTGLSSAIFTFSTGLYILETTKESSSFAINLLLYTLPIIVASPFWGYLCDKIPKKNLVILSSFFSFLVMLAVYLFWDKVDNIWLIYTGTMFAGILSGLAYLVFESGLPQMFEKEWLVPANSIAQTAICIGKILGPLLGGVIYPHINFKYFILFAMISFGITTILDFNLKIENTYVSKKSNFSFKGILDFYRENKELKDYTLGFILINTGIFMIVLVPVPYMIKNVFYLDYSKYGLILSLTNVGAIIGAILTQKFRLELCNKILRKQYLGFAIIGMGIYFPVFYTLTSAMVANLYIVIMILTGIVFGTLDITTSLYFQQNIPENKRGQIIGIVTSISKLSIPIALIVSGKLVDGFSPGASVFLGVGIMIIAGFHSKSREYFERKREIYSSIE